MFKQKNPINYIDLSLEKAKFDLHFVFLSFQILTLKVKKKSCCHHQSLVMHQDSLMLLIKKRFLPLGLMAALFQKHLLHINGAL